MRNVIFALLAAGTLALTVAPAEASGGCGPYRHRAPFGACRPPGQLGWPPGYGYGYGYRVGPAWGWRHRWHRWHHWN